MKTAKLSPPLIALIVIATFMHASMAVAEGHAISTKSAATAPAKPTTAEKSHVSMAKQKAVYPLDTCIVLGNKLGDQSVDYMYNGQLVRFCCKGCTSAFDKEPAKYLSKLDAAGNTDVQDRILKPPHPSNQGSHHKHRVVQNNSGVQWPGEKS